MHIYSERNIYTCLCFQGTLPIPFKYSANVSLTAFAWPLAPRGTFCRDSKEPFLCFLYKAGTYSPLTSSSNVPGGQYELFDDSEARKKLWSNVTVIVTMAAFSGWRSIGLWRMRKVEEQIPKTFSTTLRALLKR
ncbi:hypothetical protein AVEN_133313-1 [Araneus ventricosus]|uniref:Uncharacterized protein n=1 Tax=Araneus ventricosus TaxID=182803 RepID=A0A4Y2DN10_ARAVE|nr:hypothetical protein AVEN_133313-1 [Araneus ventricosus]